MKNILIISLEYPPQIGGIATYVHSLAESLGGNNITVLASRKIEGGYTGESITNWDRSVSYNVERKKLLSGKFMWPRWLRLCFIASRVAKNRGAELVMIHHTLPIGYIGFFLKKFYGIPYIVFSHGTDIIVGSKSRRKRSLSRLVTRNAEAIFFNSQSLRSRYLQIYPEFEMKSSVLYPAPDKSFLSSPNENELEDIRNKYALHGKRVILSVARIVHGKGFEELTEMMPDILKKIPNLVWIIVGDGANKKKVMDMVRERDLQNVVRFTGKLPHHTVHKFYYLSDLFVLLTHPYQGFEEGLGLVYLESAATGTPVVAGRSGGVDEAVLDGVTGLVVDVDSDRTIGDTIVNLLQDTDRMRTMGEAGRQRIIQDFTWEEEIAKLYKYISN